jgi:phage terminase large subunit-like protein
MLAQDLEEEGLYMIEVPQVEAHMSPACKTAYEIICSADLVHDGDPVLKRHVNNAVRRDGERGWTLSKRKSSGKIDACIALVLALSELEQPKEDGEMTQGLLYSF